ALATPVPVHSSSSVRLNIRSSYPIYPVTKQSKSNRIALMINNIKFHNDSSDRHGAEKDDRVMFNLLQSLGYQVVRYNNLTGKQIDDALTQFSQHKKLTQTDSVFVTIMSHGDMGIISGTDSKAFKTEEIFQHLNAKNCPALVNKPKIIIIQACRGGNSHLSSHTQYNTYIYLLSSITADMDADPLKMKRSTFHLSQDFICFHSSTPHTVSYRSTSDGSFFIQTLADVFNKWSHEYDIEELFRKVMQHFESSSSDYLQMPTKERNTLTKRFYLFPGQFTFYL
uniref:Caspase-13-like n=1 Tax=Maylandia zebra TaxID=106582 RepID=A0A3P9C819_9CICH